MEVIGDVMRRFGLRLHAYLKRNGDTDCVKTCSKLMVEGAVPVGRPGRTLCLQTCAY